MYINRQYYIYSKYFKTFVLQNNNITYLRNLKVINKDKIRFYNIS